MTCPRLLLLVCVAALGVALVLAPLAAGAPIRPRHFRSVKVRDNFFESARMTVRPYARVTWRWPNDSGDTHDVRLVRGPRRVRRFWSEPAAVRYRFARTLFRLGTYRLVCTFHEAEMRQTIIVRR